MPISIGTLLLLSGVGLAAAKKSKLKKPAVGTSGDFFLAIEWPEDKQAEFAYGLGEKFPSGPMRAGPTTLHIEEQDFSPGYAEVRGRFTMSGKTSASFAYVRIADHFERILDEFSVYPNYMLNLFHLKNKAVRSAVSMEWVTACNHKLGMFRNELARFNDARDELQSRLDSISQKGYVLDYDVVEVSLDILNREIPGCDFRITAESDLMGVAFFGIAVADGRGIVSENAYGTLSLLVLYGYEFLEEQDIPIGFSYTRPSMIPDFVKLKMDQFRPSSSLA